MRDFSEAVITQLSASEFTGAHQAVVSISGLETTKQVSGNGASQSVSVTLSDTDGFLRETIDTIDIHKRPARIYLGFPNVPIDQSVVLIDGEINSEIEWNERSRTLTFTILDKIEGRRFGFSAEDGLFVDVDPRTRSTPWPFRFGETCAYPAVEIRNGRTGILRIGQGVLDPTLDAKICQAKKINCPLIETTLGDANAPDAGDNPTTAQADWNANNIPGTDGPFLNGPETTFGARLADPVDYGAAGGARPDLGPGGRELVPDRECERGKFETLCQLYRHRANQLVYVADTLTIRGGDDFPQNELVDIRIDDVVYSGIFVGEVFTIHTTNRLDAPTENLDCRNVDPLTQGYRRKDSTPNSLAECQQSTSTFELRVIGGAGQAWRYLDEIADSGFKWIPSGSTVHLESTQQRVHIVSLITGDVDGVFAYRTFGDTKQLTEVPTDYYTVRETDYGDLTASEIWLDRKLSSYPDENWDDKLYIQFTSDVGPNPADVIEWIVDNYTDFTVDATSFAAVHTKLANYPCNYYYAAKHNVLDVLKNIAYEARCALFVTDNVVKLVYLPSEPTADKTFTEADIVAGTFNFNHGRTEQLVTSDEVTWEPWGASLLLADPVQRKFTVENNVSKYGFFGSTHVYRTINNEEQALKTATFWSIRNSNTWRIVTFQTTLEHMDMELFDCIQLNIGQFPNVKTVVNGMKVDVEAGIVEFECWTPVLSGTTEDYFFSWPADRTTARYPANAADVDPPLITVTPPITHPLYIPNDGNEILQPTTGDRVPSDLDDTFPTTICQDMNDPELIDAIEPIFDEIDFPTDVQQQATRADDVAANGTSFNFEEPDENIVCGRNSLEACVYEVWVQYGTATSIGWDEIIPGGKTISGTLSSGCSPAPNGPCNTTGRGVRCSGTNFSKCKVFGSDLMAAAYKASIDAQIDAGWCSWRAGLTGPVSATGPYKRGADAEDPSCQGMGNTEVGSGDV
jgi:hypothetical protein